MGHAGESSLDLIVLILKIIAAVAVGVAAVLGLIGVFASRAGSKGIERLVSELRCPSCDTFYSPEALKTAATRTENPVREAIEDGLRKLGVRMRTARTWHIICTFCGKTSRFDPEGKTFKRRGKKG